jgi:hypothetical protein
VTVAGDDWIGCRLIGKEQQKRNNRGDFHLLESDSLVATTKRIIERREINLVDGSFGVIEAAYATDSGCILARSAAVPDCPSLIVQAHSREDTTDRYQEKKDSSRLCA